MPAFSDPEIYQTVLEGLPTGVYLVDRERRIRFWNEGAEQITGYLRQDVVGRFLRDHLLSSNEDMKDFDSDPDDPLTLAFRDGKPSTMDMSILHKDGYRVPIVLRTRPIRNSHGAVVGAAESFDKTRTSTNSTRRQNALSDNGCLDETTGLLAKNFMETQLRECLITFAAHHIPFGIILLQIDHLDLYRANRGPAVVPIILRVAAQSVVNCLRPTDLIGCWDEHQFLAILMECKESEVGLVGERIRRTVARSEIEWWGDRFSVTSPMGGAGCRNGDDPEMMIARASASIRESIAKGGNCVTVLP
jgi:PAS domain S-box-containing protein/diguanylate cyclase (GGDEF)-like protein